MKSINVPMNWRTFAQKGLNLMTLSSSLKLQLMKLVNMFPVLVANTSGCDGISNKIIMLSLPYIVQHLTYVYNLSINHSCFPSDLKTAKVVPLPKVKDLNDINNYRPISVLSSISKTLEKHVYKQLPQISWQIQLNPYTSVRISTTTLMSFSTYLSCWQATILHKWLKVEWCCLFISQKSLWPYRPSDFIEKEENVSVKRQCHSVFLIIY